MKSSQKATDQQILDAYNKVHNVWKAGELLGMCGQSVHERLKRLGVNLNNRPFTENDFLILKEFYTTHELKRGSGELQEIADKLGRTKQFISRKAKQLGLTKKNRSLTEKNIRIQAQKIKEYIKIKGHPKGMLGKHHTDEVKKIISKCSIENFKKLTENQKKQRIQKILQTRYENEIKNNSYRELNRVKASWKQGHRLIDGKDRFFRSSWEFNYALYLQYLKDNQKIKEWYYESEIFYFKESKNNCYAYKPDFKIINNDNSFYFVEIKGWMDSASKKKIENMKIFYPEIKLVVVDLEEYNKFKKEWHFKLKEWED